MLLCLSGSKHHHSECAFVLCVFQSTVNKLVSVVLSAAKDIPLWTFSRLQYKQQQVNARHSSSFCFGDRRPITSEYYSFCQVEQTAVRDAGDDIPVKPPVLRPLDRQLAEHKDVTKSVQQTVTSLLFH